MHSLRLPVRSVLIIIPSSVYKKATVYIKAGTHEASSILPQEIPLETSHIPPCTFHARDHLFFFVFFFFTPPETGPLCADGIAVEPAAAGCEVAPVTSTCAGFEVDDDSSSGCRFCIFCINDRFSASNRLRNMEEYVLNFRH